MEKGTVIKCLSSEAYKKEAKSKKSYPKPSLQIDDQVNVVQVMKASHCYKNGVIGCQAIDFTLKKGDFVALIGQNGSGKTTMLKLIEGLLKPTSGQVALLGQVITKKNIGRLRQKVGFLFQNPDDQIFLNTVGQELSYVLKNQPLSQHEKMTRLTETLALIGLSGCQETHPQKLSRGQRQLLALGSIIIGDVSLIIADEPTSGLNKEQSLLVMDKLRTLAERGMTILLVTHHLPEAKDYANRIIVMHKQTLLYDFKASQINDYHDKLIAIELMEEEENG